MSLPPAIERFRKRCKNNKEIRKFLRENIPYGTMELPNRPKGYRDLSVKELQELRHKGDKAQTNRAFITMYARKQCRKRNEYWKALGYPNLRAAREALAAKREAEWRRRHEAYLRLLRDSSFT